MYIVQIKESTQLSLPKTLASHPAFQAGTIFNVTLKNGSFIFTPLKQPPAPLLEINCFGYFSVKASGKECAYLQKQRKSAELLAYLFINHDHFLTKTSIADALWPALEPARAMDNFYKAHKKLNTLLPDLPPLQLDNFRTRLRLKVPLVQNDLFDFEHLSLARNNIPAYEQAISLYRAPLLYRECYPWSAVTEAYYDMRYQSLLEEVAMYCKTHHQNKKSGYYRQKMTEEL